MTVDIRTTSTAAVPEVLNELIIDGSDVKSKVGHVGKFNNNEDNISQDDQLHSSPVGKIQIFYTNNDQQLNIRNENSKRTSQFVGLNKEVNRINSK
jgi:hypothetical protein